MTKTLYSKGMQKVLEVFYKHKTEKINFKEICRLSNLSQPAVLNHLKKLLELNMLRAEKYKNLKLYSLLPNKTTFNILASFDNQFFQNLEKTRKNSLEEFIDNIDARITILFGSVAKETSTEKSDNDLLLIYEKQNKKIIKDVEEKALKIFGRYGIRISTTIMSMEEFKKEIKNEKNYTMQDIKKTAKVLKNGEEYYEILFKA